MKFKRFLCWLFSFVLSVNILCADNFIVWDTFPMKDGSFIIILDDPAKTVLKIREGEAFSYQIGDFLEIDDLYKVSSDELEIENKTSGELRQAQRFGGLLKKQEGSTLFQIAQIMDWGQSLIVVADSEWNAKIYVDQEAFQTDFRIGDDVYIVTSISYDWPNYKEMLKFSQLGDVWWSNKNDCFINREKGIYSSWFYPWDP